MNKDKAVAKAPGVMVSCTNCGQFALLRHTEPSMVSIESLEGWTCPPLLCPDCSSNVPTTLEKERHFMKGDNVPSWIMTTHNGPCAQFGCDVNVELLKGCSAKVKAVPGTGDTLFRVFGGEHRIVPYSVEMSHRQLMLNMAPGMACVEVLPEESLLVSGHDSIL